MYSTVAQQMGTWSAAYEHRPKEQHRLRVFIILPFNNLSQEQVKACFTVNTHKTKTLVLIGPDSKPTQRCEEVHVYTLL